MSTIQYPKISYQRNSKKDISARQRNIQRVFRVLGTLAPRLTANFIFKIMFKIRRFPLSKKNQAFLDGAEKLSIPYPMHDLAGYTWGTGKTVLLVHGWESNASQFRVLTNQLLKAGYRVVAFDAPAHGASKGNTTNLLEYGHAIWAAIKQYEPYAIIAHSFGGAATLYTLGTHLDIQVERLILNGSPATIDEIIETYAEAVNLPRQSTDILYQLFNKKFGHPTDYFAVHKLAPGIKIPTLVFHDLQDTMVSFSSAEAITKNWGQATLNSTEGLNHRGALINEDVIQKMITFLD